MAFPPQFYVSVYNCGFCQGAHLDPPPGTLRPTGRCQEAMGRNEAIQGPSVAGIGPLTVQRWCSSQSVSSQPGLCVVPVHNTAQGEPV